ncbi:porin [uncultured Piscinibacter sp.]|uniref:porin n=1 Tax=uncultured Piscinibacter sp. TaxID=1131835 RepID=UPI002630E8AC|nr:porin [uncultured Piscinibacter sp.]
MKKSLLALAVLGAFAGTASAQSSVTIYGVLDMSIAKRNDCSPCAVNPGSPSSDAWTMQQSTTSRLGFRGNEDLGGGLSAQFQIEHRFNPDTGAQNQAPFWNGRSYVQLTSAAAGSVYLGREYTPAFWVQLKSDPFGNDGVGQTGVGINWAGYYTPDGASGVTTVPQANWPAGGSARTSNVIGYKTPSLGGLTANVAVSLSETTGQGRNTGFNAEYTAGPIYAGFGYEKINDGTADGNGVMNFAVHYNLGFVKPIFYYAKSKVGNGDFSNSVFLLAASAPLGNGTLKFGYSRISVDDDLNFAEDKHTKIGVGYNYNLSKRTNLYFDVGSATGLASGTGVEGERSTAYAVGVRHTF